MRKLLAGLDNVDSYIDDILLHTRTWEEHIQALRELFQSHVEMGVSLQDLRNVSLEKRQLISLDTRLGGVNQVYMMRTSRELEIHQDQE